MAQADWFDKSVALPPGLTTMQLQKAIEYVERELADLVELHEEQANVFSAVVGMFGVKALDSVSEYEKHRHRYVAQGSFPDLKRRGSGATPSPNVSLESKGSKRDWPIQSHYDHPGWYIVWRYLVDPTESFEAGKPLIIWRVDVVFLEKSDWKYEGSTASAAGGGRTATFGVKRPAEKLRGCSVYRRGDVVLQGGKPVARG